MRSVSLSLLFLVSIVSFSWAQDIITSTIKWNSTTTYNASYNNSTEEVTSLTSTASTNLIWKNEDGTIRKAFQIIEVIGEWSNVKTDGRIQYEVTDGQFSGTISIQKQDGNTKILIAMAYDTPDTKELMIQGLQLL